MKRITLNEGRERSVLRGHPWVFSGSVKAGEAGVGEVVEVASAKGEVLGCGWYSPASNIRVRMLGRDLGANWIADRIGAAVGRRADFFAHGYTNAVRLVNAESDGLPGVVADYYNGFVVCQLSTAGADRSKDEIAKALMAFAPFCRGVSERLDVKDREREGLKVEVEGRGGEEAKDQGEGERRCLSFSVLAGEEPPAEIEIVEGPCKFLVDVRKGHKTGFYLDQRNARMLVGSLANGCEVLNCFSYTGGFGLYARACGATKVTQVDISAEALALAKKNEQLAHFCGTEMAYAEADVFEYLRKCRDEGRMFDMIVLDPPKFAASKNHIERAARGYKDINLLAMKLLKPNGYLATFSCSGAMTPGLFGQVLSEAAVDAGRQFQIVTQTRQAPDHPVALAFPEGFYLKGTILRAID